MLAFFCIFVVLITYLHFKNENLNRLWLRNFNGFFVSLYKQNKTNMENGLKIVRRKNILVVSGNVGADSEWKQQSISIRQDLNDESIVTVTFKVPTKKLLDIEVMED